MTYRLIHLWVEIQEIIPRESCKSGKQTSAHVQICLQDFQVSREMFLFFKKRKIILYTNRVMRKSTFCIYENKDTYLLCGNRTAYQRLCFCYIDSTIPLLSKSKISSLQPSCVAVQSGLCGTWSETPKNGAHVIISFLQIHKNLRPDAL